MTQPNMNTTTAMPGTARADEATEANPLTLSVVIRCYNEVGNLEELRRRVTIACRSTCGRSYEIILVNDGSRDATWQGIVSIAKEDEQVTGLNLQETTDIR